MLLRYETTNCRLSLKLMIQPQIISDENQHFWQFKKIRNDIDF